MIISRFSTILLACGLLSVSARAEYYTVTGSFVQSAVPTAIAPGDTFTLTFDYNTSVADVSPSLPFAVYLNAITNLTFSLNPLAMGTYAGGTIPVVQNILLTDNFFGVDSFTVRPAAGPGSTFGAAEGKAFSSLWLQLDGSSAFTHVQSAGDVLSDILPVLELSNFELGARLTLEFGPDRSTAVANVSSITHAAAQQVPETGLTIAFVALSLTALFVSAPRRRSAE